MNDKTRYLSVGQLAEKMGVQPWQIRAAERRGFLQPPERFTVHRMYAEDDLDSIQEALTAAGYLPSAASA